MTDHPSESVQLGLDTFGDVTLDPEGRRLPEAQVIRNVVAQAVLATGSGSTSSGSANTTATTSPSRPPRSSSPRSPGRPSGSGSARR